MLNVDSVLAHAALTALRQREACPVAEFIFVIRRQFDLIVGAVRVNGEKLFAVVALAVDEGDEKAAGFWTQHILQNARLEIELQFAIVARGVLAIAEKPGIASARGRAAGLLEFVVGGIREAQHHLTEVFAK